MERESRKEQPRAVTFARNMDTFRLQISNINQGIQSYYLGQRVSGTFGAARYRRIGDSIGDKTEGNGPDSDAGEIEKIDLDCYSFCLIGVYQKQ